jgi:hypothetical protein
LEIDAPSSDELLDTTLSETAPNVLFPMMTTTTTTITALGDDTTAAKSLRLLVFATQVPTAFSTVPISINEALISSSDM